MLRHVSIFLGFGLKKESTTMKILLLFICLSFKTSFFGLVYCVKGPGVVKLTEAECAKHCDSSTPNCFFADTDDCRFYKNCYIEVERWKGYKRPCPNGQYWSTRWNVCDYYHKVNCTVDKCRDSHLQHYTNQHKLTFQKCNRNYWACVNSKSQPRCCREGETYEPGRGCVPSDCLGKCLLGFSDICKYERNGFRFGQGNKNCRKYLQCKTNIAVLRCCPKFYRYEYGSCVPDLACNTPCGNEVKPLPPVKPRPPHVKPRPVVCPVHKRRIYCPVGQKWGKRHDGCYGCIHDPAIKRLTKGVISFRACRRDIPYVDLDFKERELHSYNLPNKAPTATKIWAGGKNIKRKRDKLVFGKGNHISYLSFPWYHNNIEARYKMYVELKFKPNNQGQNFQTLLSDCYSRRGGPSFAVFKTSKNPVNKLTILMQTRYMSGSLNISYVPDEWNIFRLSYDGFYLRASITVPGKYYVNKVILRGKLVVAIHELRFGTCVSRPETKPKDQYHGLLDWIKIWGCKTGWNKW